MYFMSNQQPREETSRRTFLKRSAMLAALVVLEACTNDSSSGVTATSAKQNTAPAGTRSVEIPDPNIDVLDFKDMYDQMGRFIDDRKTKRLPLEWRIDTSDGVEFAQMIAGKLDDGSRIFTVNLGKEVEGKGSASVSISVNDTSLGFILDGSGIDVNRDPHILTLHNTPEEGGAFNAITVAERIIQAQSGLSAETMSALNALRTLENIPTVDLGA
jgi:hypothetical protein